MEVAFFWVRLCCCVYQINIGLHFSSDTAPCIPCVHLLRHVSDSHFGHQKVVSQFSERKYIEVEVFPVQMANVKYLI